MATLRPTRIDTAKLTGHRDEAGLYILAVEESDLRANGYAPGRVYDDAADVGYTLVSHRTGNEKVVVENSVQRDREGELLWTDYHPADEIARIVRGDEPTVTLRVFND